MFVARNRAMKLECIAPEVLVVECIIAEDGLSFVHGSSASYLTRRRTALRANNSVLRNDPGAHPRTGVYCGEHDQRSDHDNEAAVHTCILLFFFKQKTAYEIPIN